MAFNNNKNNNIGEEILGHICGGVFAVATAIVPGLSKNWEWDIEELGPLVPEWSAADCTSE